MKVPSLPTEILEKIVLEACDLNVTEALKSHITEYAFKKAYPKKILVQGDIQSGKTSEIIKILKKDLFQNNLKVLVIQNSLLVLKQYISRLQSEGILFQIIDSNTKKITSNVVILINNIYRYTYFSRLIKKENYILILDESDQTVINCPLAGEIEYHVTATPIYHKKLNMNFDHHIKLQPPPNYFGLNNLNVEFENENSINSFLQTKTGMMLINKFIYVEEMISFGKRLSNKYLNIPIVVLHSEKIVFFNNNRKVLKQSESISKIIDSFYEHSHIIFIANRLSLRGLSYVSTDRKRHLTHQITKVKSYFKNFMQSLRICGIYSNTKLELKLIIEKDDQTLFEKHKRKYQNFNYIIK